MSSEGNNHNDIDRMKMAIRNELEESSQSFDDLYRNIVNPANQSSFFFNVALEEMSFAGEITKSRNKYSMTKVVNK